MEKAGSHRAIRFDHSRNPRRVAFGGDGESLAKLRSKMVNDAAQFFRALDYKPGGNLLATLLDQ